MKLRNKRTGGIATLTLSTNGEDMIIMGNDMLAHITKLSELKDYEDYEEPKEHWAIDQFGEPINVTGLSRLQLEKLRQCGNDFETEEEVEKAVKKLKAVKRLKDKGFRFERWGIGGEYGNTITFSDYIEYNDETRADLDLLFGGEE